jgi:Helix-turn-helix domain
MSDNGNELLTLSEAARLLKFNTKQLKELARSRIRARSDNPIPVFKIHGKALRIRRKDLEAWIERQASLASRP